MALQKSVLPDDIIAHLLKKHYEIHITFVQKLKLGSANCYQIFDKSKCYFLKEFQSSFSQDVVVREAKLLTFLANSNIPVLSAVSYLTTRGKKAYWDMRAAAQTLPERA